MKKVSFSYDEVSLLENLLSNFRVDAHAEYCKYLRRNDQSNALRCLQKIGFALELQKKVASL